MTKTKHTDTINKPSCHNLTFHVLPPCANFAHFPFSPLACLQGQTKIADHLRKSYSMSDLTGEPPRQFIADRDSEGELDDETGEVSTVTTSLPNIYSIGFHRDRKT